MTNGRYLFHVHTYRCGHAENILDEAYIVRALQFGATDIWFSDHAPFPGDPFGNRMRYSQLQEYLETLQSLKAYYAGKINVHVGLEIEYFPSFDRSGYYKSLKNNPKIGFLLLGQHMAEREKEPPEYSFSMDRVWLAKNEYKVLGNSIVNGIMTGYFDFVAHPDRIFRRCKTWIPDMEAVAKRIIHAASVNDIPLEQNEESKRHKKHYWLQFWNLAEQENVHIVRGLDAHSVNELKLM